MEQQMNMEQPAAQQPAPVRQSPLIPIIISCVITAIIVGGGMFWWMRVQQQTFTAEISALKKQASVLEYPLAEDTLDQGVSEKDARIAELEDELLEIKVRFALREWDDVGYVFRNPDNKNQFYYFTQDSAGQNIWLYDVRQDYTYQTSHDVNVVEGSTRVFTQKLDEGHEFRGEGIIDGKLVFIETLFDDSPGPCYSMWLDPRVEYIELGVKPQRKKFTVSSEMRKAEEQKSAACAKELVQ